MRLLVTQLTNEATDVVGVELRSADGADLPVFTAGAHVGLALPGGLQRQYSLVNSPGERHRYVLGVGLAPASRGGSRYVHEQLAVGDVIQVSEPKALFGLAPEATEQVFIAGGIGITPILSMIHDCESRGLAWRLHYCVRSRARAAYAWTLASFGSKVTLHIDQEAGGHPPPLVNWLQGLPAGAHVYCCGPGGLMDAVKQAGTAAGITSERLHFERFSAPDTASMPMSGAFTAVLHRSGLRLQVRADQSLLDALSAADIEIPYSCREGLCRSCEVPLLEGQADHRDYVLTDDERESQRCILPCVSRAISPELILDL